MTRTYKVTLMHVGGVSYTHEAYDTLGVDLLLYLLLYQLRTTSRAMAPDLVTLTRVYKLMLLRIEEGHHEDPEAVPIINTNN